MHQQAFKPLSSLTTSSLPPCHTGTHAVQNECVGLRSLVKRGSAAAPSTLDAEKHIFVTFPLQIFPNMSKLSMFVSSVNAVTEAALAFLK